MEISYRIQNTTSTVTSTANRSAIIFEDKIYYFFHICRILYQLVKSQSSQRKKL